ncbi:KAT8 regulatory NSL complex subunit 1-like protein [Megalops cyprinoides]|uniref:KAT8 regulatory NSL complex subunit 1-like protein n=1 Tax=Megalops cyprinoides TaxID=118141 RepID=UPI00186554FD|nr:KAT8 regulatory NSL complex subunit 1-like protein [Megalops cyprinoides]XP_036395834.1 KAT8 regulatory NSL complex subunit 1-like protein [Megalops cyprinoides]
MAPALTKTSADGHGIHLSSPLTSGSIDLDGALLGSELDPQKKLMEEDRAQTAWLNLTFLPSPDVCSGNALELQTPLLSPQAQAPGGYKTMFHSSPVSVLGLLSLSKNLADPLAPCPQRLDACFLPVPECEGQGLAQSHQSMSSWRVQFAQPPSGHGAGDDEALIHGMPVTPPRVQGSKAGWCWPMSTVLEEAAHSQTLQCCSRQRALRGRAVGLQGRLQSLLGQHTARHCDLQLRGLMSRKDFPQGSLSPLELCSPPEAKPFDTTMGQELKAPWNSLSPPQQESPLSPQRSTEIWRFVRCAWAMMRETQKALDSDATDSSSDEEWDLEEVQGSVPVCQGCEWRWQAERAEIGSRWTWLKVRVSELELKIQHLNELHQQIISTKGGVVLAEPQAPADRRMLLTDIAGQSCAGESNYAPDPASDPEMEPSSPTRLLRNIERQSAQLTQIVNSLMPPFSFSPSSSPVSKPSCKWRGRSKRSLSSDLCFQGVSPIPSQVGLKRRRVCHRRPRLPQLDSTCISARTRPLMTYHKPRLFTLDPPSCLGRQGLEPILSLSPSGCPGNPQAVNTHPSCPSKPLVRGRCKGVGSRRPHPVLSLTSETPFPLWLQSAWLREDWVQQTALVKAEEPSSSHCGSFRDEEACFPVAFECSRAKEYHRKRPRKECGEGFPVRWTPAAQRCSGQAWQAHRKRRCSSGTAEDGNIYRSHLSETTYHFPPTPEDSPPDLMTPRNSETQKPPAQISARRRLRGECFYDIDNIVIPMSLAAGTKVEPLRYKDILTPSWRIINIVPLEEKEGNKDEGEVLSDEAFARRHCAGEQRERLRWSSWANGRSQRRSCRSSGSNADGSPDGHPSAQDCTAWRDLTAQSNWGCVHADTEPEDSLQEHTFLLPWERRAFPLCEAEEEALRPEGDTLASPQSDEGTESRGVDTYSEHSLSGADCSTTVPSAGSRGNSLSKACNVGVLRN